MTKSISFKKNMSTFSLMMTGITSIVGSGWLLATQKISSIAGPAGIFAWFIGMIVVILIALFCIEIGTLHPSAGGIGFYSSLTHGRFSGFVTQWVNWLSVLAVPAVEAQAIVRYLSEVTITCHGWYNVSAHVLTSSGIAISLALMLLFMIVNYWGLGLFTRFNNVLTVIKIIIPIFTIICLVISGFYSANFGHSLNEFAPYGFQAIGSAVISCGVIMSFNGFQVPLNFSEEVKDPKRQLPIAVIGSIIFTFVLYVVLQIVFIAKVGPDKLIHGWHGVDYRSPYVDLLVAVNLQVMSWAVMSTSAIAPAACGSAFVASGSRAIFNLARAKMLPEFLAKLDEKYTSPRAAIILNVVLSSVFLFIFRGWAQLVAVISVLHVFSYLAMPIVAVAYRKQHQKQVKQYEHKHFHVPCASLFAIIALSILAMLLFLAAWPSIMHMSILLIPGVCIFLYYELRNHGTKDLWQLIKNGSWLLYFIAGITLICYFGNNKVTNHNVINVETSMILLVLLAISSFVYGVMTATKGSALSELS